MTRALPTVLLLLLPSMGCDALVGSRSEPGVTYGTEDVTWSRTRDAHPPLEASSLEHDLHGRIRVAPDRALVRVDVSADGATRQQAAELLGTAADSLQTALRDGTRCDAQVVDRSASEKIRDALWRSRATLAFDISLSGLSDVGARSERIEACLARFETDRADEARVVVGAPLLTVDDPSVHRDALLAQAFERLREVADQRGAPPQWDPTLVRCTSDGTVSIQERRLDGVALAVDLRCQPHFPTVPRPEREDYDA